MFNVGTQITVRDVDSDAFKEFKAEAIKRGLTLGAALTIAIEKFNSEKKPKLKFSDWKATSWGKGTEHLSEEVDEILYGGK
ncbi:hypothetical protein J4479_05590 [Candidatus Woesearchaeota archaeon]|nr:hypothetical protein [Candidatus Woesearchaeota archaeon]